MPPPSTRTRARRRTCTRSAGWSGCCAAGSATGCCWSGRCAGPRRPPPTWSPPDRVSGCADRPLRCERAPSVQLGAVAEPRLRTDLHMASDLSVPEPAPAEFNGYRGIPLSDAGDRELAVQFAAVARALEAQPSVEATLQRVVDIARAIVPGCHHAGVTVLRRGRPETPAATDDVSAQVDQIQYETGEGPCLSAIVEHHTFRTVDLAAETRWPKFAGPAVLRTGVRSVLAYRLFTEQDTFGALNLYSRQVDAFDDDVVPVGMILAAHAALAF